MCVLSCAAVCCSMLLEKKEKMGCAVVCRCVL